MAFVYPQPIPDDAINLTPARPEFATSFSDIVGNAATDRDGFESIFAVAASALKDVAEMFTALEGHEGDIGTAAQDAASTWEQPFSDSLASTITQGQPDFDQFQVDLTGNSPPPPTPPGPAPGTLQIDAATSPVLPCNATQGFQAQPGQSYPEVANLFMNNPRSSDVTIKSLTLVQDANGPFDAVTTCTSKVIPSGGSCSFTFRLLRAAPDGTTAQLQALFDFSTTPVVLCLTVGAQTTGIAGGGGGGGGGGVVLPVG